MALTNGQLSVLAALDAFGKPMDDVALTTYVHHIADSPMASSGIRSRRAELVRQGYVAVTGSKRLHSGRKAAIHGLTSKGRKALSASRAKAAA